MSGRLMEITLQAVRGVSEGKVLKFEETNKKKTLTVGRTRVSTLQIKDPTVSQKHAVIECKNGQWFLTDCDSSNGSSVNGVLVDPGVPVVLRNGDLLGFGPDNEVRVKIDEPVPLEEPEEAEEEFEEPEESPAEETNRPNQSLTVKQWLELERDRLVEEAAQRAEFTVRELIEDAEVMKKDICQKAGVDYSLISRQRAR